MAVTNTNKREKMNKFDLKAALAGERVITRDGREVSQLTHFNVITDRSLCGVLDNEMCTWLIDGVRRVGGSDRENYQLFMAPKKLSGFVNVFIREEGNIITEPHDTKVAANANSEMVNGWVRFALIDLSQFDEGHGL